MERRVDQAAWPTWLGLVRAPGVVAVLAALSHGPLGYLPLCVRVGCGRGRSDAASALRALASFGMVRCVSAGSWDQPDNAASYELTDRGHLFAGLWFDLQSLLRAPRR
jgi:hypothetical protein